MKFVYVIDYEFGCVVHVAGGIVLRGMELFESEQGLCLRLSCVFGSLLIEVYERFWNGEKKRGRLHVVRTLSVGGGV